MTNEDFRKALVFGILAIFFVGMQPIVANSRPKVLDPYIFSAMMSIVQVFIFLPFLLMERKNLKARIKDSASNDLIANSLLHGWKKNKKLIFLIGSIFAYVPLLLFIGLELAGAINGAIALKSELIFTLIFGFIILKEKITKIQLIFSGTLIFGLFLALSQGKFALIELNLGVLVILLDVALYMFGHSLTKTLYNKNEFTPYQFVFLRNLMGAIILSSTYFIFYPLDNISLLFDPLNLLYFLLIGIVYGFGLLTWSKALSYMKMGKVIILVSFSTFVTALFATLFLNEVFTIFHLVGVIIVIFSIIIIIKEKEEK